MLGEKESLLMQNFYQTMTINCNIVSIPCILCKVKIWFVLFRCMFCFMCTSTETNRWEILSTRIRKRKSHNSKVSHSVSTQREQAINYCRQKQRQTQQNPHNAKDDAETNNQAITSTLTRENA